MGILASIQTHSYNQTLSTRCVNLTSSQLSLTLHSENGKSSGSCTRADYHKRLQRRFFASHITPYEDTNRKHSRSCAQNQIEKLITPKQLMMGAPKTCPRCLGMLRPEPAALICMACSEIYGLPASTAEMWIQYRCDAQERALNQPTANTCKCFSGQTSERQVAVANKKPCRLGGNRYLEQIDIPIWFRYQFETKRDDMFQRLAD